MPIQQMLLGLGAKDKPGEEASSPITNYTQAGEWHSNTVVINLLGFRNLA